MSLEEHPKARGKKSEAAVMYEFIKHGVTVLEPFGDNERYDIVIGIGSNFHRVQIKTGRFVDGRVQFETRSTGTLTRKTEKENYEGQIDLFAVYSPGLDESFVIPIEEAPGTSMVLRVQCAEKSSPNINWAEEYLLRDWVAMRKEQQSLD